MRKPLPERPNVFVSSTFLDNVKRRQLVIDAIERADCSAIGMERWTASERPAVDECLAHVAKAHVFVGILAWRYGWIPPGEDKSITELEFDAAAHLPRLIFVIDDQLDSVNVARDFDQGADRWALQAKLDEFKAKVRGSGGTVVPFKDEDLAVKVLQALDGVKGRSAIEEPDSADTAALRHERDLERYYTHLVAEFGQVRLAGFETKLRVPLRLDELYVPLGVARTERLLGRYSDIEDGAFMRSDSGQRSERHLAATVERLFTEQGDHIAVLLGHPGSGKTTQLRRVAYAIVSGRTEDMAVPKEVVPLYLPLRALKDHKSLQELAVSLLVDEHVGFVHEFVEGLFSGRLLLLLDGLDEVPHARRGDVRRWIEQATRGARGHRAVVSCRFLGYVGDAKFPGADVDELELTPLTEPQRDQFIRNWYTSVEVGLARRGDHCDADAVQSAQRTAETRARDLTTRLREQRATRVFGLAANPLLLTAICLVHRDRGSMPAGRFELYDESVNGLLELWRTLQGSGMTVSFPASQARQVLQPMALWLHEVEGRTQATATELAPALQLGFDRARCAKDLVPEVFLATIRDESGLVMGFSGEDFGFLHLTFQEYLAARELRDRAHMHAADHEESRRELDTLIERFGVTWWDEVFCILFGEMAGRTLFHRFFSALVRTPRFLEARKLVHDIVTTTPYRDARPFLELLAESLKGGRFEERLFAIELLKVVSPKELEAADRKPYRAAYNDRRTSKSTRKKLEEVLAALGEPIDTSQASGPAIVVRRVDARGVGIDLVDIPGGSFMMGSPENEAGRWEGEWPPHLVTVPKFAMARTPVTNAQYAAYLEANPIAATPENWSDTRYNRPEQPVVGVSWDEATQFCEWAGLVLPSEAQWEYACRAGTTTRYWSGDNDEDLERVGWFDKNSGRALHPVGEKPPNPFGLVDMHGNVWEWCIDWFSQDEADMKRHPAPVLKQRTVPARVLRGGSFSSEARFARSAFRIGYHPGTRNASLGFRPAQVIP